MNSKVSVIDAILSTYDKLSNSEKRIADFISGNRSEVSSLSAYEIADKCDTSRTTMSRFVRRLGFENFAQLRIALVHNEQSHSISEGSQTDISIENADSSIGFILNNKLDELRNTAAMLDHATLKKVISTIESSDFTMFAAVGNTIPVAQNAAYKLIPTIDNANDAGTKVITITSNPDSDLAKRSDFVIRIANRDCILSDLHFSQNSLNFVIEILFLFLSHNSTDVKEKNLMFWKSARNDIEPQKNN